MNENDVLRMYLLMGITDTSESDLKTKYPNMTYVLQQADPQKDTQNDGSYNQNLFKDIDPSVYQPFHDRLVKLNNNQTTPPGQIEGTTLEKTYLAAGAMVALVDSAFVDATPWSSGTQHPPSATIQSWSDRLRSSS